jgi:uroporphyrinogen decarboxylase
MIREKMTSMERVMTAISHKKPDRVPLFLLLSLYGAKEMQMSVKDYFSKAENIINAQLKMREKYRNDCLYTFFYAPIEIEAFGGEVIFTEQGPPNSGKPIIKTIQDIEKLIVPDIKNNPFLGRVLQATRGLKNKVANEVPIIGVVMSPFSLPVMQMGFDKYLELIYFNPGYFKLLMEKNEQFCVEWANAQLEAGATAICYFNPMASPNMIEKKTYLSTGYLTDKSTINRINGATATHLASGIGLPILDNIIETGTAVLGFSSNENISDLKAVAKGRICLLGNLNGIEMINWSSQEVERQVKEIIKLAGQDGGLIISDNHGEIPWQVPEKVLLEISEAIDDFGVYPLEWIDKDEQTGNFCL